jgi:hypothetical protein
MFLCIEIQTLRQADFSSKGSYYILAESSKTPQKASFVLTSLIATKSKPCAEGQFGGECLKETPKISARKKYMNSKQYASVDTLWLRV